MAQEQGPRLSPEPMQKGKERNRRRFRREYTPLPQASTDRVVLNFSLPSFIDPETIGVDTRSLERLCQMAGIRRLVIASKTDGDTTQYLPEAVGHNSSGTLFGGLTGAQVKVEAATADLIHPHDPYFFTARAEDWADLRIELNIQEMRQQIQNETAQGTWKRGIASSEAWASHINHAVADKIAVRGVEHLLRDGDVWNNWSVGLALFLGVAGRHSIGEAIYQTAFQLIPVSYSMYFFLQLGRHRENTPRFSLLGPYAPELDRAAVLKAMTSPREYSRLIPLFKAIPKAQ